MIHQEVRHAFRLLRKAPAFTGVAVLTLALGIGANTAIFSIVNAVLLKPLELSEPGQLVLVTERHPKIGNLAVSPGDFLDWRAQNKTFQDLAAFSGQSFTLTGFDEPQPIAGLQVSPEFFSLLRAGMERGRPFVADESLPGKEHVVVLSYPFWQQQFGADTAIVGKSLRLDGVPYTVVGVAGRDFGFPNTRTQLWAPMAFPPDIRTARGGRTLSVIGRMKPGVSIAQANADLDAVMRQVTEKIPSNKDWASSVTSLEDAVVGGVRKGLWLLLGAVGLVLLIACANVANLLLVRGAVRRRELAVRAALGATRRRIVRQLLVEGALLAGVGGIVGALIAAWGTTAILALLANALPRAGQVQVDWRVLLFTVAISLLTGLLFSAFPAFQVSRANPHDALRDGRSSLGSVAQRRLLSSLAVSEVALALALLIGAGLLVRSLQMLRQVETGFDPGQVLTLRTTLPATPYAEPVRVTAFYDQLLERLRNNPEVKAAAVTHALPIVGFGSVRPFVLRSPGSGDPDIGNNAQYRIVGPGYFSALDIPVIQGRAFGEQDSAGAPLAAMVNQTFVRKYLGGKNPVGRTITYGGSNELTAEVIGVAGDVRHFGLESEPVPEMYWSYKQTPIVQSRTLESMRHSLTLLVRTRGEPAALLPAIKREVLAVDPEMPVTDIRKMTEIISDSLVRRRLDAVLWITFSLLGLLLALVGIYGVLSYSVTQRTQEIGVRVAFGASPSDVLKLVLAQGARLIGLGTVAGIILALAGTRALASLLFGVRPADAVTYVGVCVLLGVTGLFAIALPARRASKVDPMVALRYE